MVLREIQGSKIMPVILNLWAIFHIEAEPLKVFDNALGVKILGVVAAGFVGRGGEG